MIPEPAWFWCCNKSRTRPDDERWLGGCLCRSPVTPWLAVTIIHVFFFFTNSWLWPLKQSGQLFLPPPKKGITEGGAASAHWRQSKHSFFFSLPFPLTVSHFLAGPGSLSGFDPLDAIFRIDLALTNCRVCAYFENNRMITHRRVSRDLRDRDTKPKGPRTV